MNEKLTQRLNDLGKHLYSLDSSLALLALGSCAETERMDEYSDLDFFVIVKDGSKTDYILDLSWLSEVHPLAYTFRNTIDGYKVLFTDGIYAEFAVFEAWELEKIPYSPGRFVFRKKGVELSATPTKAIPELRAQTLEYAVNEILTNLYVGLGRYRRGEVLSAFRLISVHAVDRYLSILPLLEEAQPSLVDPFALDRRIEERHPFSKEKLASFMQGYDHVLKSAQALVEELQNVTELNEAMKAEIEKLL